MPNTYDLTGQNVTLLKKYPKSNFFDSKSMLFSIQRLQNRGGSSWKHFHQAHLPVFSKKWRLGGGVLPDFPRCGTNHLHTTLLKTYPISNFLDSRSICFGFSAPKIGGVLTKTFSKGSSTRCFRKMAPGGRGGRFTRFDQTWH